MKELKNALRLFVLLTLVTGAAYPLATTGLAALLFPQEAAGSPAFLPASPGAASPEAGPRVVGSRLVGQHFSAPRYFHGRPSATPGAPYSAALTGGSNLAASNPALAAQAAARVAALQAGDPYQSLPIPADLVTASASGLDPDISLEAARWQAPRIARERGFAENEVLTLIASQARHRRLAFLGEPRVNVLELNLTLDQLSAQAARRAP